MNFLDKDKFQEIDKLGKGRHVNIFILSRGLFQ